MIYYGCPKCQAAMSSPDSQAGGSEKCPACGNSVLVPLPVPTAETPGTVRSPGGDSQIAPETAKRVPAVGGKVWTGDDMEILISRAEGPTLTMVQHEEIVNGVVGRVLVMPLTVGDVCHEASAPTGFCLLGTARRVTIIAPIDEKLARSLSKRQTVQVRGTIVSMERQQPPGADYYYYRVTLQDVIARIA